jgi:hypothetical protein
LPKPIARGEYKSARSAGIAAGIVKNPTPVEIVYSVLKKLSQRELARVCDGLGTQAMIPRHRSQTSCIFVIPLLARTATRKNVGTKPRPAGSVRSTACSTWVANSG